MQNKLTDSGSVLDKNGALVEKGYAFSCVKDFERKLAKPLRLLKEWDFYQISDDKYVVQFTIGHVSYAGGINAVLYSLDGKERYEFPYPLFFPFGKLGMPSNPEKDNTLKYETKNYLLSYVFKEGKKEITFRKKTKKAFAKAHFTFSAAGGENCILVATPFEKKNQFYYNYKTCAAPAEGYFTVGEKTVRFSASNSFALLDWGRGILPYKHKWLWGNGSSYINGKLFGFNLGIFGDVSNATENAVFYDGKAHKLGKLSVTVGKEYTGEWKFTCDDGRLNLTMTPVFDNYTEMNFIVAHNRCHQVFGLFNGTVILDGGEVLEIKNVTAFCESANNRW